MTTIRLTGPRAGQTLDLTMTPTQIQAAKDWITDCVWADLDMDEVHDLTDKQVLLGIARHYDGGLPAFIRDCQTYTEA